MINEQTKTTKHLLCMYQWERDYGAENDSTVVSSVISKHLNKIRSFALARQQKSATSLIAETR